MSENVFQPELYEPRRDGGASNLAKAGAANDRARITELGVIEGVEKFRAELQRRSFAQSPNLGCLGEGQVKICLVRPAERSSAEIAICSAIPDLGEMGARVVDEPSDQEVIAVHLDWQPKR